MKRSLKKFILVMILIISVGCSSTTEKSNAQEMDSFQIHIGKVGRNLGYTVESSWPLLKEWYSTGEAFTVEIDDIEEYYWNSHVLLLTEEASQRFRSALGSNSMPAFVVTVNREPLYGGMFMFNSSAMGISFPVIYKGLIEGKVAFTIRPRHDVTNNYKESDDWYGINDPRIKEILSEAGKISILSPPPITPAP